MADIDLKTETPDTSLPTTGFLFGADSQAASAPSVYSTQAVATTLLGSTTLSGATITTSQPVLDLAQTWNASGVTFTGLRFNATDTASNAASLLMDLQVGGSSLFKVSKGGVLTIGTGSAISTLSYNLWGNFGNRLLIGDASPAQGVYLSSNYSLKWANGAGDITGFSADTFLTRRAAANLRLGAADAAAPVAQTLSVQSVVAGTSNTAGANLTITGSQGTGTGAGGSIIFQVAPAGSSGTAQNALADRLNVSGDGNSIIVGPSTRSNNFALSFGLGTSYHTRITNPDPWVIDIDINNTPGGSNSGSYPGFRFDVVGQFIAWSGAAVPRDTRLYRDAANTLALRNGNNGQTFRIYGRFTDITNDFERFFINAPTTSGAAVQLGTQKGATTGAARALEFQTDGTTRLTIATNGDLTIADAENIILGTTTGTKIGTATTQKIGFYNATPVVQPTAVADATDNATAITQLNALLSRMRDLGLIAT